MKVLYAFIFVIFSASTAADEANSNDRGCCVWKTKDKTVCAPANQTYCKNKAKQSSVEYHFFKNTECRHVSFCPKKNGSKQRDKK